MKNVENAFRELYSQYPGATDADLVRVINHSDRGRFWYWFKFLLTFLLRWGIVAFFIAAATPEYNAWATSSAAGKSGIFEHIIKVLALMHWAGWLDFINCLLCYFGYRVDPSGDDIFSVLEGGTYSRCTKRAINYFLWTLAAPAAYLLIMYLTH